MKTIALVFGGESVEHEISIITAMQILAGIDKSKYKTIPVYCSKDRVFYIGKDLNNISNYSDLDTLKSKCSVVTFINEDGLKINNSDKKIFGKKEIYIDVVVPLMHGTFGEDGSIAGYFETLGATYTSSGVIPAAVSQDKCFTKDILIRNGIPVLEYSWIHETQFYNNEGQFITEVITKFKFPMVVKPAKLGSSIGITVVDDENSLRKAIYDAFLYDDKILVEQALTSFRECNCSVLGNMNKHEYSSIEEIKLNKRILSFDDKYIKNLKQGSKVNITREIPAKLTEKIETMIVDISTKTFEIFGLKGMVRFDFLIDIYENVYLNEINTIPGSLAYYLWKEKKYDITKIIDIMVENAQEQKRLERKKIHSYETNVLNARGLKLKK